MCWKSNIFKYLLVGPLVVFGLMLSTKVAKAAYPNQFVATATSTMFNNGSVGLTYLVSSTVFSASESINTVTFKLQVSSSGYVDLPNSINLRLWGPSPGPRLSDTCHTINAQEKGTPFYVRFDIPDVATTTAGNWNMLLQFFSSSNCNFNGNYASPYTAEAYGVNGNPQPFAAFGGGVGLGSLDYTNFDAFVSYNDAELSAVEILEPTFNSYKDVGTHNFFGTCPINGDNRLILYRGYQTNTTTLQFLFSTVPISCINGLWTASRVIQEGPQYYYLQDRDVLTVGENATNTFQQLVNGLSVSTTATRFDIVYPPLESKYGNSYHVQPSNNFPFRFQYELNGLDETAVTFTLKSGCTNDYTSCGTTDYNNTIDNLDIYGKGYIDTNTVIADAGIRYYQAYLTVSTTRVYQENFSVLGVNDNTLPSSTIPGEGNLGFWGNIFRFLFVPRLRATNLFTDDIPNVLATKLPFAWYYQVKDKIDTMTETTTTGSLLLTMTLPPIESGGTTTSVTSFNSVSSSNVFGTTGLDTMRTIVNMVIYILFILNVLYITHTVFH